MEELLTSIADAIWGPWMLIALLGTGLYLSIGTKFVQLTKFKSIMKDTLGVLFKKTKRKGNGEGTITPFQALPTEANDGELHYGYYNGWSCLR